jgi:hypothetical protein
MPFETVYGISLRRFPQAAEYERAKVIPNLGLFGRPVREGTVTARGIDRLVLYRVEYGVRFASGRLRARAVAARAIHRKTAEPQ